MRVNKCDEEVVGSGSLPQRRPNECYVSVTVYCVPCEFLKIGINKKCADRHRHCLKIKIGLKIFYMHPYYLISRNTLKVVPVG